MNGLLTKNEKRFTLKGVFNSNFIFFLARNFVRVQGLVRWSTGGVLVHIED